jgi:hypothetical protein
MFHADAHFRMGTAHEAEGSCCQDYALAGNTYAIVSDGCSTSGRTDIGARLWCLSAKHHFDRQGDLAYLRENVTFSARCWMDTLNLRYADMDATLGIVCHEPDGRLRTILLGDGVIAVKRDYCVEIVTVEWSGNMPGYPSYQMDHERRVAFETQSEAFAREEDRAAYHVTWQIISDGGGTLRVEQSTAAKGLRGVDISWGGNIDAIAVMTDGVSQVSGLDTQTVVTELLSIGPARQGAFAKRRLQAALKKFARDGHKPVDDISIAVLARVDDP